VTQPADFFDMPEPDVKRGVGGSPMLVHRGLQSSGTRVPYTRASYMSGFLEGSEHIHKWEMRYLAKAMGQNEDLAALAACETYSTGVSDATYGRSKSASGRRLDEIIERALDRVRIHEKADRGTAVHGFTEPAWWTGEHTYDQIPERLRGPVASFWETNRRECIQIVATEQFTANDATMSAGTFDHLVRVLGHPDLTDYVVADKKTGRTQPFEWAIQMATYAYGEPYNTADDTRPEWPGPINRKWGLVWQIDCDPDTPQDRRVTLWMVDLEWGWAAAQLAAQVRDIRKAEDTHAPYRSTTLETRLAAANTVEDLRTLWASLDDDHPTAKHAVEEKARSL
jgi:hypothetical protein